MVNVFENIPEGLGKDYIRNKHKELRQSGRSMNESLNEAMQNSIDKFPEVWVYIRSMTPTPWVHNDTLLALKAVEEKDRLFNEYLELKHKYELLKEKYKATLESNCDMDNVERVVALAFKMRVLNKTQLEELD